MEQSPENLESRRKSDRFPYSHPLIVENEKFQSVGIDCENVSETGAMLRAHDPLPVGSILSAEIPSEHIHVFAEVRWIRPINSDYSIGVAFHNVVPSNRRKLSDLVRKIESNTSFEGVGSLPPAHPIQLEQAIAAFLDPYVESLKPDHALDWVRPRNIAPTTENSSVYYTPVRTSRIDPYSTTFRIDDEKNVGKRAKLRKRFWIALALAVGALIGSNSVSKAPRQSNLLQTTLFEEAGFGPGSLEKITWRGTENFLQIQFHFRENLKPDQVSFARINSDESRELIKIRNVQPVLDKKSMPILHAFANQIRLGLHEIDQQTELHAVIDIRSPAVKMTSNSIDRNVLRIELKTAD